MCPMIDLALDALFLQRPFLAGIIGLPFLPRINLKREAMLQERLDSIGAGPRPAQ